MKRPVPGLQQRLPARTCRLRCLDHALVADRVKGTFGAASRRSAPVEPDRPLAVGAAIASSRRLRVMLWTHAKESWTIRLGASKRVALTAE